MNIHFVCRGNVLRSLIAETYAKSLSRSDIQLMSSGTNVDWSNETEKVYFAHTLAVLGHHGIADFAKTKPDQLTQGRAGNQDITVFMNQRVADEASDIAMFSGAVLCWDVTDIGEEDRTDRSKRSSYEEEIYSEITAKVDLLLREIRR